MLRPYFLFCVTTSHNLKEEEKMMPCFLMKKELDMITISKNENR